MSNIKLFLLGPPRIQRDGAKCEVDTRKAVALLAYLAGTRRRHGRDSLAALLWPEFGQSRSRAALRRTLSALKEARQEGWLEVDRSSVGLNYDDLWVDVDRFRELLEEWRGHGHPESSVCADCLAPLTQAVALYRDDFLAGFGLRDSFNFDEWQYFEAESLRRELSGALRKLLHLHEAEGEFETAIAYARRWLALDPLHEPSHRTLIELYARVGQRAAAIRQYRECARILQQDLGVAPLEETTELYEAVKEDRIGPAPAPPRTPAPRPQTPTAPAVRDASPFVGRTQELDALIGGYGATKEDGRVFVLEGEAGIGKTRLAEEFLAHAGSRGASVFAARCWEGETSLAYGPFIEGLRTMIAGGEQATRMERVPEYLLTEAARLLPELSGAYPELPPIPPLDGPGAQSRFFEAISRMLLELCGEDPPGVLFIDDLHWADAASLDLLAYLIRRLRGRPRFILATWRGEELPPDHPLRARMAEARRAGSGDILRLSRLNRTEALELVKSKMERNAGPPEDYETLGDRIYRETEGQPFFVVEYLAAARGAVEAAGDDGDGWSLPAGIRELLHSRLSKVDATGWQLLNTAAVIGRSFDFDTLREASGRGEEETITALEGLISAGLVREAGGDGDPHDLTYNFSHEKLRSLVYEETILARRRLLHRRVAETLSGHVRGAAGTSASPGRIARHYQLAGLEAEAAALYKQAGERARSLYANSEALAHFRSALALGHPDAAALHEAIGDLYTLQGDYDGAISGYETAAALCEPGRLGTLEHKLGGVHHRRGEWESAVSHYQAALDALENSYQPGEPPAVCADWSLTAYRMGDEERALELVHKALSLAEEDGDARALAQAHNTLGILSSRRGELEAAHEHLERSLGLAETLDDSGARMAALNNLALIEGARGALDQALARTETALALCVSRGDRHREAALRNNLADLLHAAGRPEESMAQLEWAVTIFAEIGESGAMQPEIWKLTEW